jgi:hypothetical protein
VVTLSIDRQANKKNEGEKHMPDNTSSGHAGTTRLYFIIAHFLADLLTSITATGYGSPISGNRRTVPPPELHPLSRLRQAAVSPNDLLLQTVNSKSRAALSRRICRSHYHLHL